MMSVASTLETVEAICQIQVRDAYEHLGELQYCVEEAFRVRSHDVLNRLTKSQETMIENVFAATKADESGS